MQLAAQLEQRGFSSSVQIIAQTGWTTDELWVAIDEAQAKDLIAPQYDFVSLLIGVNDQYRARPASGYIAEFSKLLARAAHFAGGKSNRVVVLSIPDWGQTPFAQNDARSSAQISAELDQFNDIAQRLSIKAGCHFISITELSRESYTLHPGWLADDGLHPGALSYQRWSTRVADVLLAELTHSL